MYPLVDASITARCDGCVRRVRALLRALVRLTWYPRLRLLGEERFS